MLAIADKNYCEGTNFTPYSVATNKVDRSCVQVVLGSVAVLKKFTYYAPALLYAQTFSLNFHACLTNSFVLSD